jgi:delta1-piperideine-2-carboxylate reductase
MGEVQVAARDGHKVPMGTGLDKNGEKTDDPAYYIFGFHIPNILRGISQIFIFS